MSLQPTGRFFGEAQSAPWHGAPLFEFDEIGTIRVFERDAEIFAEGDCTHYWFRVISGAVRLCKLLADGRRQIAEFYFDGDCFGLEMQPERLFSAEAITRVVTMRYPRLATEQLLGKSPQLAHSMRDAVLHDLATAQMRMLLLGRMNAAERVATFLLRMFERSGTANVVELPMSRSDIADYLGLTIETVCRVITKFRRDGIIGMPRAYRIELLNRPGLLSVLRDLRPLSVDLSLGAGARAARMLDGCTTYCDGNDDEKAPSYISSYFNNPSRLT